MGRACCKNGDETHIIFGWKAGREETTWMTEAQVVV